MGIDANRLGPHAELGSDGNASWLLGIYDVVLSGGTSQSYFLPLSSTWESADEDPLPSLLPYTLARIRRGARSGILHDASGDRSEEHTSELQSLMRISYAVFCLKKTTYKPHTQANIETL